MTSLKVKSKRGRRENSKKEVQSTAGCAGESEGSVPGSAGKRGQGRCGVLCPQKAYSVVGRIIQEHKQPPKKAE